MLRGHNSPGSLFLSYCALFNFLRFPTCSVTFTTVGYGDFAPTTQLSRFIGILLLPFGLIVVGFLLAAHGMYTLAYPRHRNDEDTGKFSAEITDWRSIAKLIYDNHEFFDADGDGLVSTIQ